MCFIIYLLIEFKEPPNEVTDAAGSCDSCHIISASLDKSMIHWDVPMAQPLRRLRRLYIIYIYYSFTAPLLNHITFCHL